MNGSCAIEVADLSKRFRLYHEKYYSLKERFLHAGRNTHEDFWALHNVSLSVEEGETVGVMGQNGSGKSTLLKCISGILQPTEGEVTVRGRLAALLELGAGFQPELSGRDNIFLNGSLLGLSTREIQRRLDEIVAFAELEQFVDNQVKYYSSGMYMRLGFAVAIHVDPDILVIDEVLAVGDENFQRKCLDRIRSFQREGRTIVFVTHAAEQVRQICDRAVVLASGEVLGVGSAAEAIRLYHSHLVEDGEPLDTAAQEVPQDTVKRTRTVVITGVDLEHPGSGTRDYLMPGEPLKVRVSFASARAVDDVNFGIELRDERGEVVYGVETVMLDQLVHLEPGPGSVEFAFDQVPLMGGPFTVTIGVAGPGGVVFDLREDMTRFQVMHPGRARGDVAMDVRVDVRNAATFR